MKTMMTFDRLFNDIDKSACCMCGMVSVDRIQNVLTSSTFTALPLVSLRLPLLLLLFNFIELLIPFPLDVGLAPIFGIFVVLSV